MQLQLFHGRDNPNEEIEDWGFNGPTIGPLRFVHTTYANFVRLAFADEKTQKRFFPDSPAVFPDPVDLDVVDGCLAYDKSYYGDWSVFDEAACQWPS